MASQRSTNTQTEALKGMLGQLADIKTYPDADIEWLLGLETQILQKLRAPVQDALQNAGALGDVASQMGGQMGQQPQGPAPQAGAPGMPMPQQASPGVAGLRQGPAMPNPDELRRLLTQGQ